MKPKQELFDLIKSLTGSEKRYFKLSASLQKGNKNYLKLFDAIDAMDVYDEKLLKTQHKKENFIKNLTFTKNYLYRLIFKSLNAFYTERSIDAKITGILNNSKILFNKALFSQFFKTVQTGKKLAEKYERFTLMIEFLEIERQLTKKEELGKKSMDELYDEEIKILEKLRKINDYKRAVSKLLVFHRVNGLVRDKRGEVMIDELLSSKLFKNERSPDSNIAKERYYFFLYIAASLKGDFKNSYEYNRKRFRLISENKELFGKFIFDNFSEALLTVIMSAVRNKKYNEAHQMLQKYNQLFPPDESNFDVTITHYFARLSELTDNGIYDGSLAKNVENFLKRYKGKLNIDTFNDTYFNLSKYLLTTGKTEDALRIINLLFESRFLKHTPHIEPQTRMLNILIHYEIGNHKLLPHLISSTTKYLKSKNKLYSTEEVLLKFLNSIVRTRDGEQLRRKFAQLSTALKKLSKDKYERIAFVEFDYVKWAENKIHNLNIKNE